VVGRRWWLAAKMQRKSGGVGLESDAPGGFFGWPVVILTAELKSEVCRVLGEDVYQVDGVRDYVSFRGRRGWL
jgi:hypothetical protein